jgi:hypothetical protein
MDPRSSATYRRVRIAVYLVLLTFGSIWFFLSNDREGPTARLAADAPYYYVYLPSLLLDGDLDFDNQYRTTRNWYRFGDTSIGRASNVFGIGPALFMAPLFAVGHITARISDSLPNGFSNAEIRLCMWASLLYTLGALFATERFLLRQFRRGRLGDVAALLGPLILVLGGPVVYYAVRQPGYAHPFAACFVAWLVERWNASFDGNDGRPRSLRTWIILGALLGAAALARPQLGLWAVLLVGAAIDDLRRAGFGRWHQLMPRWIAAMTVSAVVFFPQLAAWKALYGHWYLVPQGEGFMRWDDPAWSEVLFSSRNGLFAWAPIYAIAAIGFALAARSQPRLCGWLFTGIVMQTIANGAAWDWWAGGSFGGRRFDSCFAAFSFGMAYLIYLVDAARNRWQRLAAAAACLLGVVCAIGNVAMATKTSAPTARIQGGEPPAGLIARSLVGPWGMVVGSVSWAATLPARAAFALTYGTSMDAYDRLVGVHFLEDRYPGLNSAIAPLSARVPLNAYDSRFLGFESSSDGGIFTRFGIAKILLAFNRRHGPLHIRLRARAPGNNTEASISVLWNGASLGQNTLTNETMSLVFNAPILRRGMNVLEVHGPRGIAISELEVSVSPSTPP